MAKMFYTMAEAMQKLGMSENEVRQLGREGRLREFRDGPRLMFKSDQVEAILQERAVRPVGGDSLLDLTRESDDTSLGAILEEIAPSRSPSFDVVRHIDRLSGRRPDPLGEYVARYFSQLFESRVLDSLADDMAEDTAGMRGFGVNPDDPDILGRIRRLTQKYAASAKDAVDLALNGR